MDRKKQNYLITQLVKGVPLEQIDTRPEDKEEAKSSARLTKAMAGGWEDS